VQLGKEGGIMVTGKFALVNCTISRGGFSGERVFRVPPGDPKGFSGVAPLHFCFNQKGQQLQADDPPTGETMEGKILARVLRKDEKVFVLSLPDGAILSVPAKHVSEREGVSPDVPVKS